MLCRRWDGTSLLPVLRREQTERPPEAGIGIHGSFPYGDTNHQLDPATGKLITPFRCPAVSNSSLLGDVPANFSSAAEGGYQFSWAEGNHLKLFGCRGYCTHENCNNTSPGFENPGWHFFLYNLTADRAEERDLWRSQRSDALAMLARFEAWQASVRRSQSSAEIGCRAEPPDPPAFAPVALNMTTTMARCAASSPPGNFLHELGGVSSAAECAAACAGSAAMHSSLSRSAARGIQPTSPACHAFSHSPRCGCCWLFADCDAGQADRSSTWVYSDWTSYRITHQMSISN